MDLIPEFKFGLNNTWILSLIYLIINFGIILIFPKYNVGRLIKIIKSGKTNLINFILYYGFFIFSIFIPLKSGSIIFYIGVGLFVVGILLYMASMFSFAVSEYDKPVTDRMYKFSRHPIYISFFILLIAISLSGASFLLMIVALLQFYSSVRIMKIEEKECIKKYGAEYSEYINKVRRLM